MIALLAQILGIASAVATGAPEVIAIVQNAINAFHANDQASLDAAHAQALALANSLRPAGQDPLT